MDPPPLGAAAGRDDDGPLTRALERDSSPEREREREREREASTERTSLSPYSPACLISAEGGQIATHATITAKNSCYKLQHAGD